MLLATHAYGGCDKTSALKGLGKVKPVKTLLRLPKFAPIFSKLGDTWEVSGNLMDDLDELTCTLYGRPRTCSINELQFIIMNEQCAKDNNHITCSKTVELGKLPAGEVWNSISGE